MSNKYYDQEGLWNRELTPQEVERIDIVKKFIPSDVKTILDAGCGNGAISNFLQGFDITAMDRSTEALKYVTNKAVEGSLDALPFEDNSFDLIICSDVLEHLPHSVYQKTLKELKRVSKKYILIISPNAEDLVANQSKCSNCETVFHMNWHISSISLDRIIGHFRDDFSPVYYGYFGEKWSSAPEVKYNRARMSKRGYKHWENAVCPMCSSTQKTREENTQDVDIETNKYLKGFYNHSTEFIVLLSTVEHKHAILDFDAVHPNTLFATQKISRLYYANRQSILLEHGIFTKKQTEYYPQYGYMVDNPSSNEFNRRIVCFPYLKNEQTLHVRYEDKCAGTVSINVYDLERKFVKLGVIELVASHQVKTTTLQLPSDIVPANEGLIFELISDSPAVFSEGVFEQIYIDANFGEVNLSQQQEQLFLDKKYQTYHYDGLKAGEGFLILAKDALVYDERHKCFFLNLSDTFEFFYCSPKIDQTVIEFKEELSSKTDSEMRVLLTELKEEWRRESESKAQVLAELKEEWGRESESKAQALAELKEELRRDIHQLKVGVYNVSNAHESLVRKLRNPLGYVWHSLRRKFIKSASTVGSKIGSLTKNVENAEKKKHLLVLTPDVRIDRRTVQMCQSLIMEYDMRCTIIAALEHQDDFITDKLKVKRINPHKTEKYILRPDDWVDGSGLNLEDFYWLHPHYLNMALQENADYIMCCDLPVLPAASYVAKMKNIPLIYDAHELYPEQAVFPEEKREFYRQVEAYFIKYPDLVITVNESIALEMSHRYNISKPEVILNALDAPNSFDRNKKYDCFREKLPIGQEQKIVLFQGGYSPNRNLELLVKSAKYINNSRVVLVLMGFGDFGAVLEHIAKEDGTLNKRVFFFPAVNQSVLLEYSASADVGIIPYPHIDLNSYYCTPNKLFEFIQAGLPMIANDSPELNRFIKTNNIGFSKKIESEFDIASMIDEYFAQNVDYQQNILQVQKNICWEVEEQKFNMLMKRILS